MRKVTLYIASSLDSFIARPNGGLDWLFSPDGEDYGYEAFVSSVDTVLMGYKTYEVVRGFGVANPYPEQKSYVFTRDKNRLPDPHVEFVTEDIPGFVRNLKEQPGKTIWLVGGGQINTILLNAGLIDEILLFIQPTVLGIGLPLFAPSSVTTSLELQSSKIYPSGMVHLVLTPL